jgi:hypothetical protein
VGDREGPGLRASCGASVVQLYFCAAMTPPRRFRNPYSRSPPRTLFRRGPAPPALVDALEECGGVHDRAPRGRAPVAYVPAKSRSHTQACVNHPRGQRQAAPKCRYVLMRGAKGLAFCAPVRCVLTYSLVGRPGCAVEPLRSSHFVVGRKRSTTGSSTPTLVGDVVLRTNSVLEGHRATCWSPAGV